MANTNSPALKPALSVVSINIEGFSVDKSEILSQLCRTTHCNVLCVQETHRDESESRPDIPGLTLVAEICHPKHSNVVFVDPGVSAKTAQCCTQNGTEAITIDLGYCTVTTLYKPPGSPFQFPPLENFDDQSIKVVFGDFNSHSTDWGYSATDTDGKAVEDWAETNDLVLIHNSKQPSH